MRYFVKEIIFGYLGQSGGGGVGIRPYTGNNGGKNPAKFEYEVEKPPLAPP